MLTESTGTDGISDVSASVPVVEGKPIVVSAVAVLRIHALRVADSI